MRIMSSLFHRPICLMCGMNMIATAGPHLRMDDQTYECLRCGHTKPPKNKAGQVTAVMYSEGAGGPTR